MNRLLLLLIFALPSMACAQGVITGRVVDAAGGSEYLDEPALAGVVALPESAPPFNEITAMQWQDAFTAFSSNTEPLVPLGGAINAVEISASRFAVVEGDGSFRIEDVPLGSRLGLAVKVGELWWPYPQELKLSEQAAEREVEVSYYRLGADPSAVAIEKHYLEVQGQVREDLKYSPITIYESLRITNPDPTRAAMVEIELSVAVPPGLSAKNLPEMYASQLMYMQGWTAAPPFEREFDIGAQTAWSFGVDGGMHGGEAPTYSEPQRSPDNWHLLNRDPLLAMVGAGDTLYAAKPSPSGRSASLIFRRPVPPSSEAGPGALEIRVLHKGGVLHLDPSGKIALQRTFSLPVRTAEALTSGGITLTALVEGAHRRFYGEAKGERTLQYPTNPDADPVLGSGEQVGIVLGFNKEAQRMMEAIETGLPPAQQTQPDTEEEADKKLNQQVVFLALAILFGLAFVGALVATIRKTREEQLEVLSELPATRAELVDAMVELEDDYKKGRLPARMYKEERRRMLNRLVEFDAGQEEKEE